VKAPFTTSVMELLRKSIVRRIGKSRKMFAGISVMTLFTKLMYMIVFGNPVGTAFRLPPSQFHVVAEQKQETGQLALLKLAKCVKGARNGTYSPCWPLTRSVGTPRSRRSTIRCGCSICSVCEGMSVVLKYTLFAKCDWSVSRLVF
jgi:hypothetical protein